MRRGFAVILAILLLPAALAAQPTIAAKFLYRSLTFHGAPVQYRLFIPDTAHGVKYPLVLALHGSGEAGTDNQLPLNANRLATSWADPIYQGQYPCFVVAPQCPASDDWTSGNPSFLTPSMTTVVAILDSLVKQFPIDTNRLYVTGLSMGGFGTWDLIIHYPEKFAAAIPMSASEYIGYASAVKFIPIWQFQGALDNVVPASSVRAMIEYMEVITDRTAVYTHCYFNNCAGMPDSLIARAVESGEDLLYTEYANGGHAIWNESYDYPRLRPWVFSHVRHPQPAISLMSDTLPQNLSGSASITWTSQAPGDSVEIWFSPNNGPNWQRVHAAVPNTGSYQWSTTDFSDCGLGRLKLLLKTPEGKIGGLARSSAIGINNAGDGPPALIINDWSFREGFLTGDSVSIIGTMHDPEDMPLTVGYDFSVDGGATFQRLATDTSNPALWVGWHTFASVDLANTHQGVFRMEVSDGTHHVFDQTPVFTLQITRQPGPTASHVSGFGGGTVMVEVVRPERLTGHTYRVTFSDTGQARFSVRDLNTNGVVLANATTMDGTTESQAFDGVRLLVKNFTPAAYGADSSRWIGASTKVTMVVAPPVKLDGVTVVRGTPYPYDYLLTQTADVSDTSIALYDIPATTMKFTIENLTTHKRVKAIFSDDDGDQRFSLYDEVIILETDSIGGYTMSWGMLATGSDTVPGAGAQFLLKTKKPFSSADAFEFTTVSTGIAGGSGPLTFVLRQNFPNPFNPSTTIEYSLANKAFVRLAVYDILGREVAVLVNGEQETGNKEIRFDGSRLASGVYFCRLVAGPYTRTTKMLLVK